MSLPELYGGEREHLKRFTRFLRYVRKSAVRREVLDVDTANVDLLIAEYLNWLAQGEPEDRKGSPAP